MRLRSITIHGFKSFAKKTTIEVTEPVTGVVGPNGSGKSNIAEAIRFVLGEQSMKAMRGKSGVDVIFKGSEHIAPMSRASVTMLIDNREKVDTTHASESLAPYLVYDELVLSRVIYADGGSDYLLNDAKIRLKDVQELLSFAGIGASAHTIISQGEADRVLLATSKEKKEALEDALGLRVYHLRLNESAKKLEKVEAHLREVSLLQKELKPHVDHLERMVKKIEEGEKERGVLEKYIIAYLHKEAVHIRTMKSQIDVAGASDTLAIVLESVEKELAVLESKTHTQSDISDAEKTRLQAEVRGLYSRRDSVTKSLGRLEGEKQYYEAHLLKNVVSDVVMSEAEFSDAHAGIMYGLESLERSLRVPDVEKALKEEQLLSHQVEGFFASHLHGDAKQAQKEEKEANVRRINEEITSMEEEKKKIDNEIALKEHEIGALEINKEDALMYEHEEKLKTVELRGSLRELESKITLRKKEEDIVRMKELGLQKMLEEGVLYVGRSVLSYEEVLPEEKYMNMSVVDLVKHIERSKYKIEESRVANKEEVKKEYDSAKEREEYLKRELDDISESKKKLEMLIKELSSSLKLKFETGVQEVSKVFSEFFKEIYPEGKASLSQVTVSKINDEGEEVKDIGIDIEVSLPNKRVKELSMFSGGERTLVSIALLFAMSSITPPPFMVLDETDAPLDESNAKKYGQMLARLATKSKLLVITHNRETMNHCNMLYGVTLGVEGASRMLSVSFTDAERVVG